MAQSLRLNDSCIVDHFRFLKIFFVANAIISQTNILTMHIKSNKHNSFAMLALKPFTCLAEIRTRVF
jgi:hypothetical protein